MYILLNISWIYKISLYEIFYKYISYYLYVKYYSKLKVSKMFTMHILRKKFIIKPETHEHFIVFFTRSLK